MFAADFEPAETTGRRRSPRAPVSLDASVAAGGMGRTLCRVVDISVHGVRIQTYSAMRKGGTIWLYLPEIGPVAAKVMWAEDYAAGCQFLKPFDKEALERLAAL
jgi:hypothetical protein